MSLKSVVNNSLALEAELNKERASGVGRTARLLELQLERCAKLRLEYRNASPVRQGGIEREYAEAQAEAKKWQWYLMVQREAIGAMHHEDVERYYPLPPDLRPTSEP